MLNIITEYFYPFSDTGGPIRSIEQILKLFKSNYKIKLVCSASNHQNKRFISNFLTNCYTQEPITDCDIYYSANTFLGYLKIFQLFFINRKKTWYINGMFIPRLSLIPVLICKNVIISPRGMLINETLGSNTLLKKIYLKIYRLFVSKNAIWHATDEKEVLDIKRFFGQNVKIKLITNIPINPISQSKETTKNIKSLKLVYYGLVVEKKGLLNLIKILKSINLNISLDIYGSIKDVAYWNKCSDDIYNNNSKTVFEYKGHADPSLSQTILTNYDAFILLTKGENFGHSIYESLSVGTPVIISNKTPWKFSNEPNPPGWLVNIEGENQENCSELTDILTKLYYMNNEEYTLSSKAAHQYAIDFYNSHDFKKQYTDLFNSFNN